MDASQVIGDLIFRLEIFKSLMTSSASSSSIVFTENNSLPSLSTIGSAITLPKILSVRAWIISPPSIIDVTTIDSSVPQSSIFITESMETSHNLLVKYPEFAVFKAVSANPFLAP